MISEALELCVEGGRVGHRLDGGRDDGGGGW